MSDLAEILPQLPRLAHECYTGPWAYEFEDCRATLTKFGDVTVVAIPGTHGAQDLGDLLADGLLAVKWYSPAIGWAPEGSMRRASGLFGRSCLDLRGPVMLVGHSLGGAFAQIIAARMAEAGAQPLWLETYGAPHSAGDRMVELLHGVNGLAYENHGDPIPGATLGLWQPWRRPVMLGDDAAPVSINRHFMDVYTNLLALRAASVK